MDELDLGSIKIGITRKEIKKAHLSVNPPEGAVKISAPLEMSPEAIRAFAIGNLAWIKEQQRKYQNQERQENAEFLDRESHYLWGKRYLLRITEIEGAPSVRLTHSEIVVSVRPGSSKLKIYEVMNEWYRRELRNELSRFIERWAPIIDVKVDRLYVQEMKTRWGGCCPETNSIRINTELAKKPLELLEYVVVHELVHLREPSHGSTFEKLMDHYLPGWRHLREELNRLPIPQGEWN